ncbi:MAG: DUF4115 domain-containing protein [Dethiobacter sp.]|jgi:hypothetical protein|nr:DUF4115 domain-containing protein [Dethiobacter sp.]MBS3901982.1 DUF4115 domain-containing protein [Dethiobacter sp.]
MKEKGRMAILFIFFLLLSVGCGETVQPLPETATNEMPVSAEEAPEILVPVVPGRDPFSAAAPYARLKESGFVDRTGRDPFLPLPRQPEPAEPVPAESPVVPEPVPPAAVEEDRLPEGLIVALETVDRCWLDVFIDGRRVLRSNVAGGQTLRFEAEREIVLQQVGREHTVRLTLNGRDLGLLSHFVQRLAAGEEPARQGGVHVSLERRHSGGVLVGLRFLAVPSP